MKKCMSLKNDPYRCLRGPKHYRLTGLKPKSVSLVKNECTETKNLLRLRP